MSAPFFCRVGYHDLIYIIGVDCKTVDTLKLFQIEQSGKKRTINYRL